VERWPVVGKFNTEVYYRPTSPSAKRGHASFTQQFIATRSQQLTVLTCDNLIALAGI
jgi:hypothetical protein